MRYAIVKNEYQDSISKAKELEAIVTDYKWEIDADNPEVIFVIGGDGTFLKAVEKYNKQLANLLFIPIKSGGVGFYTNHNRISEIRNTLENIKTITPLKITLLEANKYKAINEVKVVNNLRPLRAKIYVNNELLEEFKGTGLAFTTPSGSTGFSKSQGGAVIIDEDNIFQMLEMAPVSNNIFRTINAPIILSKSHKIKIIIECTENIEIIVDGVKNSIPQDGIINIALSNDSIKLISVKNDNTTKIQILRDMFTFKKHFGN